MNFENLLRGLGYQQVGSSSKPLWIGHNGDMAWAYSLIDGRWLEGNSDIEHRWFDTEDEVMERVLSLRKMGPKGS